MKTTTLIFFLSIVISIYTAVNTYIYFRTSPIINSNPGSALILKSIFWAIVFAYPLGRILERFGSNMVIDFLIRAGSIWMGFMLYLFFIFLFVDIIKLIVYLTPLHSIRIVNNSSISFLIPRIVYLVTIFLIIISFINARIPRTHQINIEVDKALDKKLRIVAVSDIHLGTVISKSRLKSLVKHINDQRADAVFFVGDIFDEDIKPVVNNGLGDCFKRIQSRTGIYAVTGNHEFFGGVEGKVNYLKQNSVNVLRDSVVLIDETFYTIGRDDRQVKYSRGVQRMELTTLLRNVNHEKILILLDHQPFNLNESVINGIDLQISGHTHHGQIWPLNYITNAIYELSSGYLKKGNTHFVVSNGYGTWGPPLRLGSRPEILVIEIESKKR